MALLTRTVINTYTAPDGTTNATGRVRFRPNATLTSPGNDSIIPTTHIDATLVNGAITQTLIRTDDPTISPADWAWEVTEQITGSPTRTYLIQLVAGSGSVALADLAHLETAPDLVTYEELAHKGQPGGYASLDSNGLVPSAQLGLGTSATHDTGTGSTQVILGNDARLADARTPTTHATSHATGGSDPVTADAIGAYRAEYGIALNGYIDDALLRILGLETNSVTFTRQILAGTGLTGGGDLSADRTLTVAYGTSSTTATAGNDSRVTGAAQKASNLADLTNAATARTSLGLANTATLATLHAEKTGDQGQSSATPADITSLGLTIATAGTYDFEIFLPYTGDTNASSPITLNLTGPTATFAGYVIYVQGSSTGKSEAVKTALSSSFTGPTVTTAGTVYAAWIKGRVTVSATGTLQPQFAGDGTHVATVKAGAWSAARQVA